MDSLPRRFGGVPFFCRDRGVCFQRLLDLFSLGGGFHRNRGNLIGFDRGFRGKLGNPRLLQHGQKLHRYHRAETQDRNRVGSAESGTASAGNDVHPQRDKDCRLAHAVADGWFGVDDGGHGVLPTYMPATNRIAQMMTTAATTMPITCQSHWGGYILHTLQKIITSPQTAKITTRAIAISTNPHD